MAIHQSAFEGQLGFIIDLSNASIKQNQTQHPLKIEVTPYLSAHFDLTLTGVGFLFFLYRATDWQIRKQNYMPTNSDALALRMLKVGEIEERVAAMEELAKKNK